MSKTVDLNSLTTRELLALHGGTLAELRVRGVVRTANGPAGDYAEALVAKALDGTLAPNSEKSWDVVLADGTRLQVKSRVISNPERPGQRQLSPFRSWGFDSLVIVLFNSDYTVAEAVRLPADIARASASYRSHVNGHILQARPALMRSGLDLQPLLNQEESGEGPGTRFA